MQRCAASVPIYFFLLGTGRLRAKKKLPDLSQGFFCF
jgi:hypothetical protein